MTTELCNTIIIHGQPTERDRDFYNQGYEAGLRRAVEIGNEITSGYYQHAKAPYGHYQQSILAEIKGE